jgi:hypothetical protein
MMKKHFTIIILLIASAFADCESVLENNIGWTIIDSKTIDSFKDSGKKAEDGFEGCDYDRKIIFRDGTVVTCNSYGYQYAYAPTAIILGRSIDYKGKNLTMYKMIVEGEEYDLY